MGLLVGLPLTLFRLLGGILLLALRFAVPILLIVAVILVARRLQKDLRPLPGPAGAEIPRPGVHGGLQGSGRRGREGQVRPVELINLAGLLLLAPAAPQAGSGASGGCGATTMAGRRRRPSPSCPGGRESGLRPTSGRPGGKSRLPGKERDLDMDDQRETAMTCPWCGQEMELGYLFSTDSIRWVEPEADGGLRRAGCRNGSCMSATRASSRSTRAAGIAAAAAGWWWSCQPGHAFHRRRAKRSSGGMRSRQRSGREMPFWKKREDPWDWEPERKREPGGDAPGAAFRRSPGLERDGRRRGNARHAEAQSPPPMTCPWCGGEMQAGWIPGKDVIRWWSGVPTAKDAWLGNGPGGGFHMTLDLEGGRVQPVSTRPGTAAHAGSWCWTPANTAWRRP